MNIPAEVSQWLEQQGFGPANDLDPVGGGCINNGARFSTDDGRAFFLKQNSRAPEEMFAREAEGLRALAVEDGPRVPEVYLVGHRFLLLEDLKPGRRQADYWGSFGRQLAALHQHQGPRFGFEHDNYLGSTPQPNPWTDNGHEFFAEHRLLYQAELAYSKELLDRSGLQQAEHLAHQLPELIPEQPASLIHGDLWSGNAMTDAKGQPAIIDPATHYGWGEAELGMTELFGGFPETFYQAYESQRPLAPGWRQRLPIYNLYHLLNHLNIFGRSYLSRVKSILSRFSD